MERCGNRDKGRREEKRREEKRRGNEYGNWDKTEITE